MSKGKILVLSCHTHSLFWFRIDMMREFMNADYDVVAAGQESESEWASQFGEMGICYRQIFVERNSINPLKDLKTLYSIKELLDEEKPDKIFCYQAKAVIYGCLAAHSRKITEIYPLIAGLGSIFRGTGIKNKILRFVMAMGYKAALQHAVQVFFQNRDDLGEFVKNGLISEDNVTVINGSGVDTEKFVPSELPETTAFLLIARLIRDKGVGEYLDAARVIHQKHPNVRCLLVGPYDTNPSSIQPDELQGYIDDGSVEYFGEQSDVRPYINQCSVFVLPSYHEGTPKTVLEAMASGRAVITTDAPGCRETVTDGENGYLIPVRDTDALVKTMEAFIENPSLGCVMAEKGRNIAVEKFDVKRVNREIMKTMKLINTEVTP